jgi:hypothetical protein
MYVQQLDRSEWALLRWPRILLARRMQSGRTGAVLSLVAPQPGWLNDVNGAGPGLCVSAHAVSPSRALVRARVCAHVRVCIAGGESAGDGGDAFSCAIMKQDPRAKFLKEPGTGCSLIVKLMPMCCRSSLSQMAHRRALPRAPPTFVACPCRRATGHHSLQLASGSSACDGTAQWPRVRWLHRSDECATADQKEAMAGQKRKQVQAVSSFKRRCCV